MADEIFVWMNGQVMPRDQAVVSVFDASFQSGDSVWEGLRVYGGMVFRLEDHLRRLRESAKALDVSLPPVEELVRGIYEVLDRSGLDDGVHIRLIVSRGTRKTSGMDPRNVVGQSTVVIIPERKAVAEDPEPMRLATSYVRRPTPDTTDAAIHHSNQLNTILARLSAYRSGADAALMLDPWGFVAESDTASIFCVLRDEVVTPEYGVFVRGITRSTVLDLCAEMGLTVSERRLTLAEVYSADEVFVCGTVCELVPVLEVDGRQIGGGRRGPKYLQLLRAYRSRVREEAKTRLAHGREPLIELTVEAAGR
ncbi:MAG: aminotransferase class IV [Candidatus Dormibacteria bacterium]